MGAELTHLDSEVCGNLTSQLALLGLTSLTLLHHCLQCYCTVIYNITVLAVATLSVTLLYHHPLHLDIILSIYYFLLNNLIGKECLYIVLLHWDI